MTLVPMRFKGVQWRYNPQTIKFECDKNVKELASPYATAYIQNLGRKNMVVSGEGTLCGEDCMEQFAALLELFRQGGEGVLAIPHCKSIFAVFESLQIVGEPKPDMLKYSFVFREVMDKTQAEKPVSHIVAEGENLWDISYAYGIAIDTLVKLNSWVKRPDELTAGRLVSLC